MLGFRRKQSLAGNVTRGANRIFPWSHVISTAEAVCPAAVSPASPQRQEC